ncbi:hypothetical protein ACNE9Y_29990 [Pseudomonas sp. NY11226]|uniref:hypothetical protein n=1 Tax=Pseudomonas sp. NY11226 TaxID=3400362 RepID=UPI003A85D686
MFKFIKEEFELMFNIGPNEKLTILKLFVFFLFFAFVAMTYNLANELVFISAMKLAGIDNYTFNKESICSAPPSPEFTLMVMCGFLALLGLIALDNHRLDKEYETKK